MKVVGKIEAGTDVEIERKEEAADSKNARWRRKEKKKKKKQDR